MIDLRLMQETLRACFGSALAEDPAFVEGAARILCACCAEETDFGDASGRMEDYLFNSLYERLGPGMTLRLPGGGTRRVRMSEIPALADQCLYPLFASMPVRADAYDRIYAWWLKTGSLSAMRALLLRFRSLLPEQDQRMIERIVAENVPIDRQAAWFSEFGG